MQHLLHKTQKARRRRYACACMLIASCAAAVMLLSAATAGAASISASVDKTSAAAHEHIDLTVSIEGTRSEPALPPLPEFDVRSRGSSSKVSIVNGTVSSSVEYRYSLIPKKTGTFTIGPFSVTHDGRTLKSNKIKLTITEQPPAQDGQQTSDIFVTAEVDDTSPYCNEQIIYTFRFYRKVRVADARLVKSPSFEGFLTREIGKEKEYKKNIRGHTYAVTELTHALFPLAPGVVKIKPSVLQCRVVVQKGRRRGFFNDPFFNDPFFGFSETETKTFTTGPITVMVKPLPKEGMPEGFKNLVGDYSLDARLSTKAPEAGSSVTLTLTLSGTGNLKSGSALPVPAIPNVKAYDDKPEFEPFVSGGKAGGKLVIKKALVPLKAGSLSIPRLSVPYFDPESESYKTAEAGPFVMHVQPSDEKESLAAVDAGSQAENKQAIKIIGEDILPIHSSAAAQVPERLHPLSALTIGLFLAPIALFFTLFSIKLKQRNAAAHEAAQRARSAHKIFTKKLPAIKKASSTEDPAFYQLGTKALKEFLGSKLGMPGSALTAREISDLGKQRLIDEASAEELKRLFEFFDAGQYGFSSFSLERRQEAVEKMINLTKHLNKQL